MDYVDKARWVDNSGGFIQETQWFLTMEDVEEQARIL